MRRSLILTLLVCLVNLAFAQNNYETGFYITQAGEKVEGLVKNQSWRNNPARILFKNAVDDEPYELTPETAQTIQIGDKTKFIGGDFDMDYSSDNLQKITTFQEARLERNPLFLKVIIDAEASLYEYSREGFRRYFYSVDNGPVQQLVYKAYQASNVVQYNRLYKTQLWDNMKCESISLAKIQKLDYFKKDLQAFFIIYNQCQNAEITDYTTGNSKPELNIWIRPGVQNSSVEFYQIGLLGRQEYETEDQVGFRIGALLEYKLPFRNGKLSVIAEPTFQSASFRGSRITPGIQVNNVEIDYSSIVLPIGIRYYLLNKQKSRLSLSGMMIFDLIDFNSTVELTTRNPLPVNAQFGLSGELEYRYDNRFSLGLQYGLSRDLISNVQTNNNVSSDFSYLSLMLGYKIF